MANRKNLFDSRISSRFYNTYRDQLNMDTSLLYYTPDDMFNYNSMNPSSLQIQSVDEMPYDPSTLNVVYQSLPPVQGPPVPTNSGTVGASLYSPVDFDTEEEMMDAGAEGLNWTPIKGLEKPVDFEGKGAVTKTSDPIVNNMPSTKNVDTGNAMLEGAPVSTGISRDVGESVDVERFISDDVIEELENIRSVPAGTVETPKSEFDFTPEITGEELMNNPEYRVPELGSSDVTESQFVESVAPIAPETLSTDLASEATGSLTQALDKVGGITNVVGGASMALGNIGAMSSYDSSIDDLQKSIKELAQQEQTVVSDAQRQSDDIRDVFRAGINTQENTLNEKLATALKDIENSPKNIVGNFNRSSKNIRRSLSDSLDNTVKIATEKLDSQLNRISEGRRDTLAYLDDLQEQQKQKIKEMEKEKDQAMIGAAVGIGSIFADAVLPGSGQVLRTGYSAYQSRA